MAIKLYKANNIQQINITVNEKELAGETLINIHRVDEPRCADDVYRALKHHGANRPMTKVWYQIIMRD